MEYINTNKLMILDFNAGLANVRIIIKKILNENLYFNLKIYFFNVFSAKVGVLIELYRI